MPRYRRMGLVILGLLLCTLFAACGNKDVPSSTDTLTCIFESRDGQLGKLNQTIEPGSKTYKLQDNERAILIPTSNRFYMMNADRSIADPGAPNYAVGTDKDGVSVQEMMQARFVFYRPNACDWFAQHGKRNTDTNFSLGFNVRGDAKQGWATWLNENFGVGLQAAARAVTNNFAWKPLTRDYDVNADALGKVTGAPGGSSRTALGVAISKAFTTQLTNDLGGKQYFCGISYDPTKPNVCPPIDIQIIDVSPADKTLLTLDEAATKAALTRQQQNKDLEDQAAQAKAQQVAEKAKFDAEAANQAERLASKARDAAIADLDAKIKNAGEVQLCAELAKINVNCADYLRAKQAQANGTSITVNPPK